MKKFNFFHSKSNKSKTFEIIIVNNCGYLILLKYCNVIYINMIRKK